MLRGGWHASCFVDDVRRRAYDVGTESFAVLVLKGKLGTGKAPIATLP